MDPSNVRILPAQPHAVSESCESPMTERVTQNDSFPPVIDPWEHYHP